MSQRQEVSRFGGPARFGGLSVCLSGPEGRNLGSQSHGWLSIELFLFSLWAGARRRRPLQFKEFYKMRKERKPWQEGGKRKGGREGGRTKDEIN